MGNAYAKAGVDYKKIGVLKELMKEVCRRTNDFPRVRSVDVMPRAHGASFSYHGPYHNDHSFITTMEGLGNKSWIAE